MTSTIVVRHALAVLAAACSAVTLFAVGHYALGIDVETVEPARVTVGSVLGTSALSAALGWSLLSALVAWTSNGRVLWTRIAVTVMVLSLLGPLTTPDLTGPGRVLLALLHLTVGAVTITVLLSPRTRTPAEACGSCGQLVGTG